MHYCLQTDSDGDEIKSDINAVNAACQLNGTRTRSVPNRDCVKEALAFILLNNVKIRDFKIK